MPEVEFVTFTPELAEQYLRRVDIQRKLKPHVVAGYAKDMLEARWTMDSNAICMDEDGALVNGQHRLKAVVKSGCTVTFPVMRGLGKKDILHMDSGAARTAADQLHILGIPNAAAAAALVRIGLLYRALPGVIWTGPTARQESTHASITEYSERRRDVVQVAIREAAALKKLRFNGSVMGALYVLVDDDSSSPELWGDFMSGLLLGANLRTDDPRLALRNYWIRPDLRSWGYSQSHLLVCIKAWNKFVDDADARMFKMPRRDELPLPKVK
jgi:hypothetical protein